MPEIPAQQAADAARAAGVTVTRVKTESGRPSYDAETGRYKTEAVPVAPEHVIGVRDVGSHVSVVTCDGARHLVPRQATKGKGDGGGNK